MAVANATKWTIKGRVLVACNCDWGCPCQFEGDPTHGHCQVVASLTAKALRNGTGFDTSTSAAIFTGNVIPGYALGGFSVGESPEAMHAALGPCARAASGSPHVHRLFRLILPHGAEWLCLRLETGARRIS